MDIMSLEKSRHSIVRLIKTVWESHQSTESTEVDPLYYGHRIKAQNNSMGEKTYSRYMVLQQLEIHNEVNLPDAYLTTFYDLFKMNHKPKYEVKLKIPEGNI